VSVESEMGVLSNLFMQALDSTPGDVVGKRVDMMRKVFEHLYHISEIGLRAMESESEVLVTHKLEDGPLVVTAEVALDHVLQRLRIALVEDRLNIRKLVALEVSNDPRELLIISTSAVHRLVETLGIVVIRGVDKRLKELLKPARHLLADRNLQRVLVLLRVRRVEGLVVPRRLVAKGLVELLLVSADLALTSLVEGLNVIRNLSGVDLGILITVATEDVLDGFFEIAREILNDFVLEVLGRIQDRLHLLVRRKSEDIDEATLVRASTLHSLEETLLLHLELRLEAINKNFAEPARGLALDLLAKILAVLRLERLLDSGKLLTRTIADDLNKGLLISPNALHGVAKVLRIFVRMDLGVIVGRGKRESRD